MRIRRSLWHWSPPILWATVLFLLSAIPGSGLPQVGFPGFDKVVHGLVYFVLGALCFRALRRTTSLSPAAAIIVAAAIATGYGITDELHQSMVPRREPDVRDGLADATGGILGALCGAWLARRRASPGAVRLGNAPPASSTPGAE